MKIQTKYHSTTRLAVGFSTIIATLLALTAPDGQSVPLSPDRVAPGHVSLPVANPLKWDNERPNLYRLTIKLEVAGKVIGTVNVRTRAMTGSTGAPPSYGNAFPQPLCAAALRIGGTSPAARGGLDLQHVVATLTAGNGDKTAARVLADRNVLLIDTKEAVSIEPCRGGQTGRTDGVDWLHVTLPGDIDYKGMEYCVALAGTASTKVVSLVTSFDISTGDVRGAAIALARKTVADVERSPEQLIAGHEKVWRDFWARSGVELADRDLQHWWYRMMYFARTVSQPGGRFPAALMPPLATDDTPWHADFHFNYNSWQPFWSVISANHPQLADPWIAYVNRLLPRAQWQAKEVFDCEGVFYSISQHRGWSSPVRMNESDGEMCTL